MNHALGRLGLPPAPADAIRRTIGLDPRTALGILAGEERRSREDEFLAHFIGKADEVMVASTTLLPGAARVLRTLHDAGHRVGVVTTKYRRRVVDALERDELRALVNVVVGADDAPRPKFTPDGLLRAGDSLRILTGDCVSVGNSGVDAMATPWRPGRLAWRSLPCCRGRRGGGVPQVSGVGEVGGVGNDVSRPQPAFPSSSRHRN